jgi:hypothetical protein
MLGAGRSVGITEQDPNLDSFLSVRATVLHSPARWHAASNGLPWGATRRVAGCCTVQQLLGGALPREKSGRVPA